MKIIDRVKLFYVALAWSGIGITEWAKIHGVSRGFVHDVIWGKKRSARLINEIDKFIKSELKDLVGTWEEHYKLIIN
jgi:hypothetical protein